MPITKLPITEQQATFLNEYVDAVTKYRDALEDQTARCQSELNSLNSGKSVIGPRTQTDREVVENYGRLKQLDRLVWTIFDSTTTDQQTVGGYLTMAMADRADATKPAGLFNRHYFEVE